MEVQLLVACELPIARSLASICHETNRTCKGWTTLCRDFLQTRLGFERQDPDCLVLLANDQKLAPLSALRHVANVKTANLSFKELCLVFAQHACQAINLEVNDLSTLYVYDNLSRVGARLQNSSFI